MSWKKGLGVAILLAIVTSLQFLYLYTESQQAVAEYLDKNVDAIVYLDESGALLLYPIGNVTVSNATKANNYYVLGPDSIITVSRRTVTITDVLIKQMIYSSKYFGGDNDILVITKTGDILGEGEYSKLALQEIKYYYVVLGISIVALSVSIFYTIADYEEQKYRRAYGLPWGTIWPMVAFISTVIALIALEFIMYVHTAKQPILEVIGAK